MASVSQIQTNRITLGFINVYVSAVSVTPSIMVTFKRIRA